MINIYDLLRQKEMDCARLRYEIDALRIALPLLTEKQPGAQAEEEESFLFQESTGTDGPTPSSVAHIMSRFWKRRLQTNK